jgi:Bacterial Ig domain/Papain family cysteine protease
MKLSKFLSGMAVCIVTALLITSCKKELNNNASSVETESKARLSGVVEDDPALVNKVPVTISSDFFKQRNNLTTTVLLAKGKPDVIPPAVTISSPVNAVSVSGTINIQATASDNIAVALVTLSVDGTAIANKNTSPYIFPWNSATVTNGTHTLAVTAKDAAGNSKAASIQISVNNITVGDIIKPTITITSPTNGASVSGTVSIAASASDNISVSDVKFSIDGNLVGSDNSLPYSFSWSSATVAAGTHTLMAMATDAAGNSNSNSVQVTVNTTVLPPEPLPSSAQLLMPPIQNQGGEGICVPFAAAYAARSAEQYYRTSATSYSFSTNIFSPEFIYNQIKTSDCGSGTGVITALDFLVSNGVCTWQTMPYSSSNGCSLLPAAAQLNEAANYKITSYSKIATSDSTGIKTMIVNKHPVIITIGTDDSFWNALPGFIWQRYSGPIGISHTLVICGYDDTKKAYKVMNSWGTAWGESGFSWIDYNFLPLCSAYYCYVITN